MRSIIIVPAVFILSAVATACATQQYVAPQADPAPPGGPIHVLPRQGARYDSTTQIRVGVMDLLPCATPIGAAPGRLKVTHPGNPHSARTGAGDVLSLPPGAAAAGTSAVISRLTGSYRAVEADASGPVRGARITLDLRGCGTFRWATVVRYVSGGTWEDVGGTVSGNTVTSDPLSHLSIYAVAGGN